MSSIKEYAPRLGPGYSRVPAGQPASSSIGRSHYLAYAKYDFSVDGGAVATITPKQNSTIPNNAIITQVVINIITTLTGTTGNVSFGLSAGSTAGVAAFLAATARASLATDTVWQGVPVQQATGAQTSYIKMTADGTITMTISTNALTAGKCEVFVDYLLPNE